MRIAIINNKQAARHELSRIVSAAGQHKIAWTASTGEVAITLCEKDLPDLILMDPIVRDLDGVKVIRHIMKNNPCPILIVTGSVEEQSELVFSALGAGAMDAVNTPISNSKNHEDSERQLLRKISAIEVLTRQPPLLPIEIINGSLNPMNGPMDKNIVAIGCSSGGPEALSMLLAELPHDFQSPIVVVQHVDAAFAPGLAKWLNVKSSLPVELAKEGSIPTSGKVYLAATNSHLVLSPQGQLRYINEPEDLSYRPSVDVFFRSLVQNWKHTVTAILLTGMGSDGAKGMLELRTNGAYTIAQDRSTSAVFGMPKAAVKLGAAAEILPINRIAKAILANCRSPVTDPVDFEN